jgi:hypothetical protein
MSSFAKSPRIVDAEDKSDQISAHRQQDVEHTTSRAGAAVPPLVTKL